MAVKSAAFGMGADELSGAGPSRALHCYRVFGLHVHSELALPELPSVKPCGGADVEIHLGHFPPFPGELDDRVTLTSGGAVLNVGEAGRFLIENGRRIVVEPGRGRSDRSVRLYLLGSAFGILLHQRRLLPLHANAVVLGGKAFAFMGVSGAGKSTMAAWFHDRGYPVLSDDVSVVTANEGGSFTVQPGIPRLRLWQDALSDSGRTAGEYERSFDDADKFNVPTRPLAEPAQLGAIYLLDSPGGASKKLSISALHGVDAVDAVVSHTYRGGYIKMLGGTGHHLAQSLAVVAKTPVFAVERSWEKANLESEMRALERHATGLLGD